MRGREADYRESRGKSVTVHKRTETESRLVVTRDTGRGKQGVGDHEYEFSFWGDTNVLEL